MESTDPRLAKGLDLWICTNNKVPGVDKRLHIAQADSKRDTTSFSCCLIDSF